jgi:Ca-activated chloride channel family protein
MRDELLFVSVRYKTPGSTVSVPMRHAVRAVREDDRRDAMTRIGSNDLRFAASVAGFAMLLRDSEYRGALTVADVLALAQSGCGDDAGGHRREFLKLVEQWKSIVTATK